MKKDLLKSLHPVVKTNDVNKNKAIKLWKEFINNIDIEETNRWSQEQVDDGLDVYFYEYPYNPTRRDMAVIASLLAWLPSNCGRSFLSECEKMSKILDSKDKGYVCAWAIENNRVTYMNHGYTCLEYLLSPIEEHDSVFRGLKCTPNYFISIHDMECANYFVKWLASQDGQMFLDQFNDTVVKFRYG